MKGTEFDHMANTIRLIAVYSENVSPLFENFAASLRAEKNGIDLEVLKLDLSGYSGFGFGQESWYEGIRQKWRFVIEVMRSRIDYGDYFFVSDVDIHFFRPDHLRAMADGCAALDLEFAGVLERPVWRDVDDYYNAGFLILRKCEGIEKVFEDLLIRLAEERPHYADQDLLYEIMHRNEIVHGDISPRLGILGNRELFENSVFLHATHTRTCEEKIAKIADYKERMKRLQTKVEA